MTSHNHRILRKRDGYLSGSVVESVPTPTGSALAQDSAAAADSNPTPSGIPLVTSSAAQNAPASAASSAPTTSATSSTASGDQISLGTVVGACVAALIALILALILAFYCSRRHKTSKKAYARFRNTANNASRRRSHLESWKRMDDKGDRSRGQEQAMEQRPPSGPLGAMFHRTISNTSGEKSLEGHNREEVGSMQHFVKYHPGLAVEMASQAPIASADHKIAKPSPVLRLPSRGEDLTPLSWDRDTVGGESYLSAQSDLSKSTTPLMMATAKSTPPAMTSSLHRWESAEVLHASQIGLDSSELQNPFSDSASSVKSIPRGQNPFFSGRDHTIRRTLLPSPHENPFSDANAPSGSATAIQSLIAALEAPLDRDGNHRIVSVQSSVYSRMSGDDGDSAIDFTAFPYPPASRLNIR